MSQLLAGNLTTKFELRSEDGVQTMVGWIRTKVDHRCFIGGMGHLAKMLSELTTVGVSFRVASEYQGVGWVHCPSPDLSHEGRGTPMPTPHSPRHLDTRASGARITRHQLVFGILATVLLVVEAIRLSRTHGY